MSSTDAPRIEVRDGVIVLLGRWTLASAGKQLAPLRARLNTEKTRENWDLEGISGLDTFGALLLWRLWGRTLPSGVRIPARFAEIFATLSRYSACEAGRAPRRDPLGLLVALGQSMLKLVDHVRDFTALIGQLVIEFVYVLRSPSRLPLLEISANLHKAGVRAMPVSALVAFLIGVVLSYLFALQLKRFGAEAFIVDVLGVGVIRELGPVLVAVLVAGRSGSSITAQLGVMRVTEEIDALATMGVPRHLRLVFPKVLALGIAMPLLVAWTCAIAILGGMLAAHFELGLDYEFFLANLPRAVPLPNLWIALGKGMAFGVTIALVACHFGLRSKPNTESLSRSTTQSVVAAITLVILLDAVFALATRNIGLGWG